MFDNLLGPRCSFSLAYHVQRSVILNKSEIALEAASLGFPWSV